MGKISYEAKCGFRHSTKYASDAMNIKKYQMSLKQYRAFYSVQCRRTYSDT